VIRPCTVRGTALGAQETVLSRIDTAAQAALARLPCNVPDDVWEVLETVLCRSCTAALQMQWSVGESLNHALLELAILPVL
jgi:hypothetical protein